MATFEKWFDQDLTKQLVTRHCEGIVLTGDNLSNVIGVRLYEGDAPATLDGAVTLRAIRADMIVVFAHPKRHEEASANAGGAATDLATTWLIKRVVAVPGEPVPPELGWNDQTVPAGCLVVYGDNRRSSHDSRHFGYVRRADVRGVAVQKHLPDRGRRRLVENSPGEGPWQRTYRHRGTA